MLEIAKHCQNFFDEKVTLRVILLPTKRVLRAPIKALRCKPFRTVPVDFFISPPSRKIDSRLELLLKNFNELTQRQHSLTFITRAAARMLICSAHWNRSMRLSRWLYSLDQNGKLTVSRYASLCPTYNRPAKQVRHCLHKGVRTIWLLIVRPARFGFFGVSLRSLIKMIILKKSLNLRKTGQLGKQRGLSLALAK